MNQAQAILAQTVAELQRLRPGLRKLTIAGDLRRSCELVSDLQLVAIDPAIAAVTEEKFDPVTLHTCPADLFGAVLVHATGGVLHVGQLADAARKRRLTLAPDGLCAGARRVSTPREEDVYAALGLPLIPPELREGTDEIALARKGALPRLVTMKHLRGVLHIHTDFSDGMNTLEEMAEAARERGYAYLGVADHSQSARCAGGLQLDAIGIQHEMVDALNRRYRGRFRILKGIESDILADGALDYPAEILGRLSWSGRCSASSFSRGAGFPHLQGLRLRDAEPAALWLIRQAAQSS